MSWRAVTPRFFSELLEKVSAGVDPLKQQNVSSRISRPLTFGHFDKARNAAD
jgi:hypothetical protein